MELLGMHHLTAVTAHASENLKFYTNVLGMRLVKKTVNQDDVSAYHLFYADKLGTPGTDITFFDWAHAGKRTGETDGILRTFLSVPSVASLHFWKERLSGFGVQVGEVVKLGSRSSLFFEDAEGQRIGLVSAEGAELQGEVWDAEVPATHAIRGLYGVELAVPELIQIEGILVHVLGMVKQESYESVEVPGEMVSVFSMGEGGAGREVHVVERKGQRMVALAGGVHHVAFRVGSGGELLQQWAERLNFVRMPNSGLVDRFYFKSLYFRISDGILFELATDDPGFASDEDADHLGEKLALPPFLEDRRTEIEAGLKAL
ncbi:ring-cleaving dioxygenase [soil metagenome]